MAWDFQTYKTRHSWIDGNIIGSGTVGQPTSGGYTNGLPNPIFAGDSFEWIIDFYEYYRDTENEPSDFGATGVAKLYIIWANVADATPTEIATGVITEITPAAGYNRVTFQVDAGDISTDWASSSSVMIYAQMTTSGKQRTAYQILRVMDRNGDSSGTPAAGVLLDNVFVRKATINPLSATQTTIWTVPTGYQFIASRGEFLLNSVTTPATPQTYKWGTSADTTLLQAATVSVADAAGDREVTEFDPALAVFAAGDVIQYGITSAATHAAASGQAMITGYLLEV